MWGYIARKQRPRLSKYVPSLYVRVYRVKKTGNIHSKRSLIICEGISQKETKEILDSWFPHYMWGYIDGLPVKCWRGQVPSLYVRVYRRLILSQIAMCCSLIICEGISYASAVSSRHNGFPHYMWGYIANRTAQQCKNDIPSLYVRVYRLLSCLRIFQCCSLIICEGISEENLEEFRKQLFPHYMWGYIVISGQFAARRPVPSLHVSVYRNRQWHPSGLKKYKCSWR